MYKNGSHTKYRLMYHIVWIPKYRKRVLQGKLSERLKELIVECAEIHNWHIEELNIQKDHVHLLIQLQPSISVSDAVKMLKGGSSRKIRKEFPDLAEFYWNSKSFWADGYFAETIGKVDEKVIRNYIINQ